MSKYFWIPFGRLTTSFNKEDTTVITILTSFDGDPVGEFDGDVLGDLEGLDVGCKRCSYKEKEVVCKGDEKIDSVSFFKMCTRYVLDLT